MMDTFFFRLVFKSSSQQHAIWDSNLILFSSPLRHNKMLNKEEDYKNNRGGGKETQKKSESKFLYFARLTHISIPPSGKEWIVVSP